MSLLFSQDAAAQEQTGAQDETEIVPAAVVMDFVEANMVGEDGDDEGDRCDHAVPDAFPEPGGFAVAVRW